MTSAEFSARYQLLKPVADGKIRTLNALATANGKVVMVHYLVGTPDENAGVLARMGHLPEVERLKVVESIDVEGHPVIVTQFLPGFESLESWIVGHMDARQKAASTPSASAPVPPTATQPPSAPVRGSTQPIRVGGGTARMAPPVVAAPPAPPPTDDIQSQKTQLISPPVVPPAKPAAATPAVPAERPASPAQPAPPGKSGPGEFTRLFNLSSVAPSPTPVAPPAPVAPPVTHAPVAATPTPTPPPAPKPEPAAPGEFTRIFQMGQLSSAAPTPTPPAFTAPPPPAFTPAPAPPSFAMPPRPSGPTPPLAAPTPPAAFVPAPAIPAPSVLPPTPASSDITSATGLMNSIRRTPEPTPVVAPPVAAPAPMIPVPTLPPPVFAQPTNEPSAAHVPSEFTRILSAATPPSVPAVAAPVVAAPAGPAPPAMPNVPAAPAVSVRKPSWMPLIIGLNVLAILAIGLVVLLVMRRK